MSLGIKIAAARKAKGMSQTALAERLGVSTEAVSKWERDQYAPAADKLAQMEEELGLQLYEDDGTARNLRYFDEEHMSAYLKGRLNEERFPEASRALRYAKEKHAGQLRKPKEAGIPYIIHPLTLTCHALAMGLEEDFLLASLLLHDVSEDCGVKPEELPFAPEVQRVIALVTKPPKPYSEAVYYAAIAENPMACMVKCIDRCNNLSEMSKGFSREKIAEYVKETETYYPALLKIIKSCPAYNNAAWLLSYQIRSLLSMAKRIG